MKFEKHKIGADRYTWRCYNSNCIKYRKRVSIRKDSIFFGLRLKLKKCLRVMLMWLDNANQSLILKKLKISYSFYRKIINLLLLKIKSENAINPLKFGGVGTLIQIDETMQNLKCKSHRGRSSKTSQMHSASLNLSKRSQNFLFVYTKQKEGNLDTNHYQFSYTRLSTLY
ncbi:hypothetical protein H312_01356 [Anncaliia algerae PRA339]|uniref:ISXO2-like transposase domain-containing protein n=1 Tax=Anncaliia algerae PRA339 TaxID=1288291 RepID=A0A059F200_9MICR|nr:hypothetical protein H312_01356 [Anncaliia algerae PRA339]